MHEVVLNETEQQLVRNLAEARNRASNAKGRSSDESDIRGNNDLEIHIEGLGAEIAVAKYLNLYPDLRYDYEGQLPKYDLVDHDGLKIDVKVTSYPPGNMTATRMHKVGDSDKYVSVLGKFPFYKIVGWCYGHEFLLEDNLKSLSPGRAPCYFIPETKLRNFPYV